MEICTKTSKTFARINPNAKHILQWKVEHPPGNCVEQDRDARLIVDSELCGMTIFILVCFGRGSIHTSYLHAGFGKQKIWGDASRMKYGDFFSSCYVQRLIFDKWRYAALLSSTYSKQPNTSLKINSSCMFSKSDLKFGSISSLITKNALQNSRWNGFVDNKCGNT